MFLCFFFFCICIFCSLWGNKHFYFSRAWAHLRFSEDAEQIWVQRECRLINSFVIRVLRRSDISDNECSRCIYSHLWIGYTSFGTNRHQMESLFKRQSISSSYLFLNVVLAFPFKWLVFKTNNLPCQLIYMNTLRQVWKLVAKTHNDCDVAWIV